MGHRGFQLILGFANKFLFHGELTLLTEETNMCTNKHTESPNLLSPGRCEWRPTPVLLPGKSHGWRSLEGCRPWGRKQSDTTERLHFHFSFSCIGEGNGNPLQCSCLENPRDGGAWWAAISGVAQSRTWLKWLSGRKTWKIQGVLFVPQSPETKQISSGQQTSRRLEGETLSVFSDFVIMGTSLVAQWLRLWAPNAEGLGSIPG